LNNVSAARLWFSGFWGETLGIVIYGLIIYSGGTSAVQNSDSLRLSSDATLAVYDAMTLRRALADGDVTALTRVPGIGKRGAERLVLELRDKIGPVGTRGASPSSNGHGVRGSVVEALVGLGFAARQAEEATTSTALRSAVPAGEDEVSAASDTCPFMRTTYQVG
jgi:hypothetical protein